MSTLKDEIAALMKFAEHALAEDTKDYFVSYVVDRVDAAYQVTKDPGLHMLRNAVAANVDRMIISRADLGDLWLGIQSSVVNHEAVQIELGDLVGGSVLPELDRTESVTRVTSDSELDVSVPGADRFAAAFGGKSRTMTRLAEAITAEIQDAGLDASLEIAAQDSRFAVFTAQVSDGSRIANILVPVELTNGVACLPSVFYGEGFAEFTGENLTRCASLEIYADMSAVGVLDTLNRLAGPIVNATSTEDWAGQPDYGTAFDLGNLDSPVIENAPALETLSAEAAAAGGEDFERIFKEATLHCGKDALASAREMLTVQLKFARVTHDNIVVESEFDGGLRLATNIKTSVGKQSVIFPIEFGARGALIPEIMQVGSRIVSFDEKELQALARSGESDLRAMSSSISTLGYGDLYRIVVRSAQNSDLAGAEEAMAVILENHGEDMYRRAFQDMADLMTRSQEASDHKSFDDYADQLANEGDEIARYTSNKVNAAAFGLLD